MSFLKILTSIFLIIGVSGSVFDDESDLYSSKTEAFEQCEEWKDEGNVVVYPIHVNIAEEASRFNLEHPAPLLISPSSTMGKLKYADRVYEWNQLVKNFLDNHPAKAIEVHSRMCEYEPKEQLFVGYENKLIQDRVWKDAYGMRGRMEKVKSFRY